LLRTNELSTASGEQFLLSLLFELSGQDGEIPLTGGFSVLLSTDRSLFRSPATAVIGHNF
jgi:hypothetical protein